MAEWKEIPGTDGAYRVSTDGQIESVTRSVRCGPQTGCGGLRQLKGRVLHPFLSFRSGHPIVQIQGRQRRVALVVAETWLGPKPARMRLCYRDGDRTNVSLDNLYYSGMHYAKR